MRYHPATYNRRKDLPTSLLVAFSPCLPATNKSERIVEFSHPTDRSRATACPPVACRGPRFLLRRVRRIFARPAAVPPREPVLFLCFARTASPSANTKDGDDGEGIGVESKQDDYPCFVTKWWVDGLTETQHGSGKDASERRGTTAAACLPSKAIIMNKVNERRFCRIDIERRRRGLSYT